jgi:TRAP-type C4-dicarboxylate transport system permease small subunit
MKIDSILNVVLGAAIGLLMFCVMGILFIAVIFRYFLNNPIFWADEMATYLLVGITFLGGYLALRQGKMVRVTFFVDILPVIGKKIVSTISCLIIIGFLALIMYQGNQILHERIVQVQKTVALRMPIYIFYILIPIMAALLIFGMIIEILKLYMPEKYKVLNTVQQRSEAE